MPKPISKSSAPQGSRLHVLIVEHSQADVELCVKELERAGIEVNAETAETPEQFKERLTGRQYDIVLADYRLPGWTGMDALEVLRQQGRSTPFILVTGTLGEQRAVECIKLGATDYVLKDHLSALPVAVRRALEAQKLRDEREQAEGALLASERKFRALSETASCAIYLSDRSRFLYVNPASEVISGYTRAELMRMSPFDVIHPDYREQVRQRTMARLRGEHFPTNVETPIVTKSGDTRWLDFRVAVIAYEGEPVILATAFDVTERRQAEATLRDSEERYRDLVENIQDLICTHDLEGRVLSANPASARLLGYTPEELLGRDMREMLVPWSGNLFDEYLATIQRDGQASGFMRVQCRSGEQRIWEYRNTLRTEGVAKPIVRGFARDVTERKQAEVALRESEERFRRMVELSPEAILVGCEGRLVFANPAGVKLLGATHEGEVLGRPILKIVHPDFHKLVQERIQRANETGLPLPPVEERFVRLDGSTVEVEAAAVPFLWEGKPATRSVIRDITDRKQAEGALRQSEAALRSLVDNAPYGIYQSKLATGKFALVNPAMVQMLGYGSAEEVLALDMARDVYRILEERTKVVAALRDQGAFRDLELHWKRKDGSDLVVRTSGRIVHVKGGDDYFEVIAEDVTERRLLEQEFRQAQKMEAIGQLAGGVAHDFNNLLMAMSSFTELAGQAGPTNEKQQHYLQEVLKATRRAAGLTQQLLAFSRKQVLAPSVLDLKAVVNDFGKMLPPLIGEHVEVRLAFNSQEGRVQADRGQIEQILMNLAVNARDAMPKGGTLVIEVNDAVFEQDHLSQNYTIPAGSYVLLAVSDNGEGITRETIEHIFEPFFTTKERGKGTGLGLSTVYGIVKQSGGYISAYSEPGVGTTFKIYLPRAEKPVSAAAARPEPPVVGGTETILLVEDESAVRIATREFLETKGYQILEAANAAEAQRVHSQHAGRVHLVITDVVMPGISGPDLAERLKHLDPNLRVLYVSGYTDGAIASVAGLQQGGNFLQKPFGLEVLARKVRAILDPTGTDPAASGPQGADA